MENQTAENSTPVASVEPAMDMPDTKQKSPSAFAQITPKWLMLAVLVLAAAILAYGYNAGHLKQVSSKANAVIASIAPEVARKVGIKDKLTAAREAYAAGDVNTAIEAYRAFIAGNPADMAAHGELGNVLYSVGALPEAAQAYFVTASMAIEQNRPEIAEALLPSVIEGNPMLAHQLSDKLFDAQVRANFSPPFENGPAQQNQQQS